MGSSESKMRDETDLPPVRRRRSSTITFMSSKSSKSSLKEPSVLEQAQLTLSANTQILKSQALKNNIQEMLELKLSNADCYQLLKMPGKAFLEVADIFSTFFSYLQSTEHLDNYREHVQALKAAVDHIPVVDAFTQARTTLMRQVLGRAATEQPSVFSDEISMLTLSFAELYNYFGYKNESLSTYKALIDRYMVAMQETSDDANRRVYAEKALDLSKKISVT